MKIALVSLDQIWEDKIGNQAQCSLISQRISQKFPSLDLIVYPEMTLTGFSVENENIAELSEDSETIAFFKLLAINTNCGHIFGLASKDKVETYFNRCVYVDRMGDLVSIYDKMHTFSFSGENKLYSRGGEASQIDVVNATAGLSICYDLRFPELYTYHRPNCNLMVNIANWPASRKEHWFTLLRARAIENQFFMIGVNRQGVDGNGFEYEHSSVIYDPLGSLVPSIYADQVVSVYDIDLQKVVTTRKKFPFSLDRRSKLYKELLEY
jgi:omega-amidase